jgi:putative hydrolases of HD superfamily
VNNLETALALSQLALRFARVERATFHDDGKRVETDSDHTVMLGLIACELAPEHLDKGRISQYALVHDIVEAYSGDVQTLKITDEERKIKSDNESAARERLIREFGEKSWMCRTLVEYEEQVVPEARFVRLLDKVTPKLTHIANGCIAARLLNVSFEEFKVCHKEQFVKLAKQYPEFSDALDLLFGSMLLSEEMWGNDDLETI